MIVISGYIHGQSGESRQLRAMRIVMNPGLPSSRCAVAQNHVARWWTDAARRWRIMIVQADSAAAAVSTVLTGLVLFSGIGRRLVRMDRSSLAWLSVTTRGAGGIILPVPGARLAFTAAQIGAQGIGQSLVAHAFLIGHDHSPCPAARRTPPAPVRHAPGNDRHDRPPEGKWCCR